MENSKKEEGRMEKLRKIKGKISVVAFYNGIKAALS